MGDDYEHWTFTIDQEEKEFDYVERKIKDYGIIEYLLSHEEITRKGEKKPHYHGIVYTTKNNATNLVKHYVEKYKLRNTSGSRGGKRHYTLGKKPLYDVDYFRTYCCKDGNIRSSMTEEQLEYYIKRSYKKEDRFKLYEEIHNYLERNPYTKPDYNYPHQSPATYEVKVHIRYMRETIIRYIIESTTHTNITKGLVDNFLKYHLFKVARSDEPKDSAQELYHLIY